MAGNLRIDTGPIDAMDYAENIPVQEWPALVRARADFCRIRLPYDCRELLRFVEEAQEMLEPLGYKDVPDFVKRGLQLEPELVGWAITGLQALKPSEPIPFKRAIEIGQQEIGKGKPGPGRGHKTGVINTRFPETRGSTNVAYLTARLARDRPDILARLQAGEYNSTRAAAKDAGIVKDKTPLQHVQTGWRKANADERQRIKQWILSQP